MRTFGELEKLYRLKIDTFFEMLEALEAVDEFFRCNPDLEEDLPHFVGTVREAIRKARGE